MTDRTISLADDAADHQIEQEAEKQRSVAYDATYQWHGTALHPFSIGREALYLTLRSMNAAVPLEVAMRHPESFLGDAIIILFLCAHTPAEFAPVRHDLPAFFNFIDAWATAQIPRAEATEAIDLALRILNDAGATRAITKPSDRGSEQLGN